MFLSKTQYARHRGCTPSTVTLALKSGRITAEPDGRINPKKADQQWDANTDVLRARPMQRKGDLDGVQAEGNRQAITTGYLEKRSTRESLLIERLQIENAVRRGELVSKKQITAGERAVTDRILALRNSLLEIPDRLAGELAAEDDHHRIRELLNRELVRIFERFARGKAKDNEAAA